MDATRTWKFDFAISFSGAQRATAAEIASGLQAAGFAVFYDKDEVPALLGEDGESYLRIVYSAEARFYVVLVSRDYDRGFWTQLELQAIRSRESLETGGVLIPVLVSRYRPQWLGSERIYLDLRESRIPELVEILTKKAKAAPMPVDEARADPCGFQLMVSGVEVCSFEYGQFRQKAMERLRGLGLSTQDWTGPRNPALNPILRCRSEDRLIALRIKAVIDSLLQRYGPVKGEIEGELKIELGPVTEMPSAGSAILYL